MKYKVGDEFVFVDNPQNTNVEFAGERCLVVAIEVRSFRFTCAKISDYDDGSWSASWTQIEDTIPSHINDSPLMKALR